MGKRIEINGKFYRKRRGKLVEIPLNWVGNVTHPQTIRKRPSKQIGKIKKYMRGALAKGLDRTLIQRERITEDKLLEEIK